MTEMLASRALPSFSPALLPPPSCFARPSVRLLLLTIFLFSVFFFCMMASSLFSLSLSPIVCQGPSVHVCCIILAWPTYPLVINFVYSWCTMMHGSLWRRGSSRHCEQRHVTQTHTHTHRHKSEPWQSFADISPPATTHTYSAAAYMQGQRNMEKDRTVWVVVVIISRHRQWM